MRRRRQTTRGRLIVIASVTALALAAVMAFAVVRFAARNPDEVNLGPSVFRFKASRLAREIEERGPFLHKDPLDRGREVYIHHLGPDPNQGWLAVRAYASRESLDCLLRWAQAPRRFVDPCTGQSYPDSGEGLTTYPATVRDGVVSVDLRAPRR